MATTAMARTPRFPPTPSVGDQFTTPDGRVYEWDGSAWLIVPAAPGVWLQAVSPAGAIYYSAGNVGVDQNHPQYPLDVDGSINGDALYLNGVLFATFV